MLFIENEVIVAFHRELIEQDALTKQYKLLVRKGYGAEESALHLARFAEAKIYVAAEQVIEKLEKEILVLKSPLPPGLQELAQEKEMTASQVRQFVEMYGTIRGKKPTTLDEWLPLYDAVKSLGYLEGEK